MKRILLMITAAAVMVISAACSASAQVSPTTPQTGVEKQYVEAYGTVKAAEVKNITLDFEAPVTAIHIKEGQRVISGQKLVSLELTDLLTRVETKELELAAARSGIDRSRSNTDLRKLRNDLENARNIYDKSLKELASKEELYKSGSISLSELDAFKKQVESDRKAVADINFSIESLQNDKGSENESQNLSAAILESDLKLLQTRLGKPYIKDGGIVSDIQNGLVYEIGYVQGDVANPDKKILSLMDLDSLVVEANVPEEFIKNVRPGALVTIIPTADKTRRYTGKVTDISGNAVHNNGETLITVLISIENKDEFLLPGFNVDVEIAIQS